MTIRPTGFVTVTALALAGCSGGSGNGQPSPVCAGAAVPDASGPGDAQGWLPLGPGWGWNYRLEAGSAPRPADLRIEVGAPASIGGFSAVELRGVDPVTLVQLAGETSFVASTAAGLVDLSTDPADPIPATYELRFPVTPGQTWSTGCSGMDYGEDLDGDGRNESIDLRLDGQVLGLEDVTVPAGSFAGTAHVRLDATATLHPTAPGYQPVTAAAWQETWYAPGVGIVRRSSGGPEPTQTYDLVGWSGPDSAGGVASLTRLIVPPPNSDPFVMPWRVVPRRSGAQRALVLQLAWDAGPVRLVGRFVDAGAATVPFDVVPQWPGDTLLPWGFAHQVAPGPDQHLVAFAVPQALGAFDVRAARISAAGVARDAPAGLFVAHCDRSGTQAVAAARVGTGFLVAWSCDVPAQGVFAAMVSGDGVIGDPVQLGTGVVQFIQASGDGTAHLVVWGRGFTSETEMVGVRVSPEGAPLDPAPVRLVSDLADKRPGDLACGSSTCLLTWLQSADSGGTDLLAIRVAAGQPLDPEGVRLGGAVGLPLAAPSLDGFAVAWNSPDGSTLLRLGPALEQSPPGGVSLLPYGYYDSYGTVGLLSASATDAWASYVWIESYAELRAARWVW